MIIIFLWKSNFFHIFQNIKMINDSQSVIIFVIFQLLNHRIKQRFNQLFPTQINWISKKTQNQSILRRTIALINIHRMRIRLLYSEHFGSIESNGIQSSPIEPGWIPKGSLMMMMMMTAAMILLFFSPFSFDGRINSLLHYVGIRFFFNIISFYFFRSVCYRIFKQKLCVSDRWRRQLLRAWSAFFMGLYFISFDGDCFTGITRFNWRRLSETFDNGLLIVDV